MPQLAELGQLPLLLPYGNVDLLQLTLRNTSPGCLQLWQCREHRISSQGSWIPRGDSRAVLEGVDSQGVATGPEDSRLQSPLCVIIPWSTLAQSRAKDKAGQNRWDYCNPPERSRTSLSVSCIDSWLVSLFPQWELPAGSSSSAWRGTSTAPVSPALLQGLQSQEIWGTTEVTPGIAKG